MAITDVRLSVLDTVNEMRRRRGLRVVSDLAQDSQSIVSVKILNDVIAEISDYGDWNETLVSANVTTISSANDYSLSVPVSGSQVAVVKTIKDIYEGSAGVPLFFISQEEMRLIQRVVNYGPPRQYTVWGTDSNGNPVVRVNPVPSTTQGGVGYLSVRLHTQPPTYTTDDGDVVIPFTSRMVVQGLVAESILDEEGGSPTDHYSRERQIFDTMLKVDYNRFKADVGRYRRFVPGSRRFRRGVR